MLKYPIAAKIPLYPAAGRKFARIIRSAIPSQKADW
jgi:hypothetical protein